MSVQTSSVNFGVILTMKLRMMRSALIGVTKSSMKTTMMLVTEGLAVQQLHNCAAADGDAQSDG